MPFIERLNQLLKENKTTAKHLAESLGLNRNVVTDWRKGNSSPSVSTLIKISQIFSVSIDWLLGVDSASTFSQDELRLIKQYQSLTPTEQLLITERLNTLLELKKMTAAPPLTLVPAPTEEPDEFKETTYITMRVFDQPASAGIGNYLTDTSYEEVEVDEDEVPDRADFGVRIWGDSMEPLIANHSIVWVREQSEVQSGEIGIFILNGEALCKKLKRDFSGKVFLISLNRSYEPIEISQNDIIKTVGNVLISSH